MQCLQDEDRYFVRLDRGDNLFEELIKISTSLKLASAHISGIGALKDIELGYFEVEKKEYLRKTFEKDSELLSLDGNIAQQNGKPVLHLHAVLGDENFQCFGGHLFNATVAVTAEINIRVFNQEITRSLEPNMRFNQLQFCGVE